MLPVFVNLDGSTLSYTRELVIGPDVDSIAPFLPPYQPQHAFIRGDKAMTQGAVVLGGAPYSYFCYQQQCAQENALAVHEEIATAFADVYGRQYGLVEAVQLDDADYVLVMSNAFASKGKAAVRRWRSPRAERGVLRRRVIRPFPAAAIASVLTGRKAVAVIDQNLAPGLGGITYQEITAVLYHQV